MNSGQAFDLGTLLPDSSPLGSVLAGLFGYRSAPTPLEAFAYLAYLIPVLMLFVWGGRRRTVVVAGTAAAIGAATVAIALAG